MMRIIKSKRYKGVMGESDSEVIRAIVTAYLSENGEFESEEGQETLGRIAEQLGTLEAMYDTLAKTLERKKIINERELDDNIRKELERRSTLRE
jgi:hypothetical protein